MLVGTVQYYNQRLLSLLPQVFSHSSNTASVDTGITNKLLKVNRHESEITGVNIIYKDISTAYFVDKPGKQQATEPSKQPIRTHYLDHVTGYQLQSETSIS